MTFAPGIAVTRAAVLVAGALTIAPAAAQRTADIDFASVGRAAPLEPAMPSPLRTPPADLEAYPPAELEGLPERYWMVGPYRVLRARAGDEPVVETNGAAWNGD